MFSAFPLDDHAITTEYKIEDKILVKIVHIYSTHIIYFLKKNLNNGVQMGKKTEKRH